MNSANQTQVPRAGPSLGRTAVATAFALSCFAANSWLCRAALRPAAEETIDPVAFTALRLAAGGFALALLAGGARRFAAARTAGSLAEVAPLQTWARRNLLLAGSNRSAFALFAYAIAFSLAYLSLDAGPGALILFACVQLTMFVSSWRVERRLRPRDLVGALLALVGLVVLLAPGSRAPDPWAAAGMAAAGVAWGVYSLRGRGVSRPLEATAGNFVLALPWAGAALALAFALGVVRLTSNGVLLATVSGALTSGVGYAVWYKALRGLRPALAGLLQLAVPVLAALGGVLLLGEEPTWRLAAAGLLVLTGVSIALGVGGARR